MALRELLLSSNAIRSICAIHQDVTRIRAALPDFFTRNRQHLKKWLNQMQILMVVDQVFIREKIFLITIYMQDTSKEWIQLKIIYYHDNDTEA